MGRSEDLDSRRVVDAFEGSADWTEVTVPGHADPLRVAIRENRSRALIVIDDDALPVNSDWASSLTSAVLRDGVACVGSRVLEDTGRQKRVRRNAGRVSWYGRPIGNVGARDNAGPIDVDSLPEGNWAWRADVIEKLTVDSIFDLDDGSMYGLDLCLQAKAQGWRVQFLGGAPIRHFSAPREGAAPRSDRERAALSYSRNLTFIVLSRLRWRRLLFFAWSMLVGDSGIYGLVSIVRDLLLRRVSVAVVKASLRGRALGFRWWLRQTRTKTHHAHS